MSWQKHMSRGTVAMARADYRTAEAEFQHALKAAQRDYAKDDERLLRTLGLLERLRAEPKVPTPISTTAWTRSCASW